MVEPVMHVRSSRLSTIDHRNSHPAAAALVMVATLSITVFTSTCILTAEADSVSVSTLGRPSVTAVQLHNVSDSLVFTGLMDSVKLLSPSARDFVWTAACTHGHEVHIHTSNRDDELQRYNGCPVHVHEARVEEGERVRRIAVLRDLMRDNLRSKCPRCAHSVVVLVDFDLAEFPALEEVVVAAGAIGPRFEVLASNGLMFRPEGYYDLYATVFKDGTFAYKVDDRLDPVQHDGEDAHLIWGSVPTELGKFVPTTQADLWQMIARSKVPVPARSAFGGLALYLGELWLDQRCSYSADPEPYRRYALAGIGRACEHVVFHACLESILRKQGRELRLAIDPTLRPLWSPRKTALVLWATMPVPNLKGSDSRIINTITALTEAGYIVDVCFKDDIGVEIGSDLASRVVGKNATLANVRRLRSQNCELNKPETRYDVVMFWVWFSIGYNTWALDTVRELFRLDAPPKVVAVADDAGIVLRVLRGVCLQYTLDCVVWTTDEAVAALRKFAGLPTHATSIKTLPHQFLDMEWVNETISHEFALYSVADMLAGINEEARATMAAMDTTPMSMVLPYVAETHLSSTQPLSWDERAGVIFVGYRNSANAHGIAWFLDNVLPMLDPKTVQVVHICGLVETSVCSCENVSNGSQCKPHPLVSCHGWISASELDSLVRGARVAINPSMEPAGVATKSLYALSRGTPVVSTTFDGSFVGTQTKAAIVCAITTPTCFADGISRLLTNRRAWQRASRDGPGFVSSTFSQAAFNGAIAGGLARLNERRPKSLLIIGEAKRHGWSLVSQTWHIANMLSKDFTVSVLGPLQPMIEGVRHFSGDSPPRDFRVDITISQGWPPNFDRDVTPFCGVRCRTVLILPWEFGSLPSEWIGPLMRHTDAVWAPSNANRAAIVRSGFPLKRTAVAPCGIVTSSTSHVPLFNTSRRRSQESEPTVHFAFSGGLLPRKGVDLIFNAWNGTHCDSATAKLTVITSYELGYDQAELARFQAIVERCGNIKWHRGEVLSESTYHDIMNTVDVYVGPSRGEGFGLPIVEAMARGQQIITTTGLGTGTTTGERTASDDFANNNTAYLVHATPAKCTMYPCSADGQQLCVVPPCANGRCTCVKLANGATWLEPDLLEMEDALTKVFADIRAGKTRLGWNDAMAIRQAYSWESEGFRMQYVKLLHGLSEIAAARGAIIPAPPQESTAEPAPNLINRKKKKQRKKHRSKAGGEEASKDRGV